MTDEQRDQLAQMLGPINRDVDKNKVEADFEAATKQLQNFIEQRRIAPEDLPHYKVQKVVVNGDCMTIVTDTIHYVHVLTESSGYGDSAYLSTSDHPNIEDARNLGILSQEQYDEYKKAQQAYLGQCREINVRNRLKDLVHAAGAATVQEYLDELNQ